MAKRTRKNKFVPPQGSSTGANPPVREVIIDHARVDCIVVDDTASALPCRPWITIAVNKRTSMSLGSCLSLAPPERAEIARCIDGTGTIK